MNKTIDHYEIKGPSLSERADITCRFVLSRIREQDDYFFSPLRVNSASLTDGELQRLADSFEQTAQYFNQYAEIFRDELLSRTGRGTRSPRFMPGVRQAKSLWRKGTV